MPTMTTIRRIMILLLSTLLLSATNAIGLFGLGDLVYDPANHQTAILTQVNTAKSIINEGVMIANQAKQIEHQLTSLWNEAQHLKTNPLRLLGQLEGLWQSYNILMKDAEGLTFSMAQAHSRFEATYPALSTGSVQDITRDLHTMVEGLRKSAKTTVNIQSIYERLCNQLDQNKQALTAAEASVGTLQVGQAQAQLSALTNEHLATLAQIEAANGRVQTEWIAMQVKERADADKVQDTFMAGYGTEGFKPVGQRGPATLR